MRALNYDSEIFSFDKTDRGFEIRVKSDARYECLLISSFIPDGKKRAVYVKNPFEIHALINVETYGNNEFTAAENAVNLLNGFFIAYEDIAMDYDVDERLYSKLWKIRDEFQYGVNNIKPQEYHQYDYPSKKNSIIRVYKNGGRWVCNVKRTFDGDDICESNCYDVKGKKLMYKDSHESKLYSLFKRKDEAKNSKIYGVLEFIFYGDTKYSAIESAIEILDKSRGNRLENISDFKILGDLSELKYKYRNQYNKDYNTRKDTLNDIKRYRYIQNKRLGIEK